MLEKHHENLEFVVDLRVQFFLEPSESPEQAESELSLQMLDFSIHPRVFPNTLSVDWDYGLDDDQKYFCKVEDVAGEHFWPGSEYVEFDFPSALARAESSPPMEEWLMFARLYFTVDAEFDWDFEDEEGMELYFEKIQVPIFNSLRLQFGDAIVSRYSLDPKASLG